MNESRIKYIEQKLKLQVNETTTLKEGRVYLLETTIGKLVYKKESLIRTIDGVFFHKKIESDGVLCPHLFDYGIEEDGDGFLVLEYIENCEDTVTEKLRDNALFWKNLAQTLRQVNNIPVGGFGFNRSSAYGEEKFTSSSFVSCVNIILKEIESDLSGTEELDMVLKLREYVSQLIDHDQAFLTHGDMGGNNFLWDNKKEKMYFFDASYLRGMPKTSDFAYFSWRIHVDRVTDGDVEKLKDYLFPEGLTKSEEFEVLFLRVLAGLLKIRDGIVGNKLNIGHVESAEKNLEALRKFNL